jgi:hypothetical protein
VSTLLTTASVPLWEFKAILTSRQARVVGSEFAVADASIRTQFSAIADARGIGP